MNIHRDFKRKAQCHPFDSSLFLDTRNCCVEKTYYISNPAGLSLIRLSNIQLEDGGRATGH